MLKAYWELLLQTCHKRGTHALGGVTAQIPVANEPGANAAPPQRVHDDKWVKSAPATTATG